MKLSICLHHLFGALVLLFLVTAVVPVGAQQPTSVNPSASVVTEEQLLRQLRRIEGRGTILDAKSYVIEQPDGRMWTRAHQTGLPWIGGIAILGIIGLLAIAYLIRGTIRIDAGRSGRTLLRFTSFERFAHWLVGVTFVVLALTGLNITFGKRLLLPLLGPETFTAFSTAAKYAHDYASFPFVIGVGLLLVLWVKENFPTAADFVWLKKGGGFVGHEHPPAWKFNAGQKMLFWFVILATIAVAVTGYFLMFPFYFANITGMQIAQVLHGLAAMAFIALIIAHIYIGTIGMEGGFDAMANGEVDLNWAKQHHSLWVEQELGAKRNTSTGASVAPAE
jgi:formate dehydrogenase subunit gamma